MGTAGFHIMAKPSGPVCNLDCQCCFYLEKEQLYPGTADWRMTDAVLETFIRQYIAAHDAPVVHFTWQGGEPTLAGLDFFRRVVELQQRFADGKRIENGLQTNGVLLDAAWCDFLAERRFLVGLSIDGPRDCHDRYRVDKGGRPTFEQVMRGLRLLQAHGVQFNTLTTVHRYNSKRPVDVYRFLVQVDSRFMQFIPVVERVATRAQDDGLALARPSCEGSARVTAWSVEPLAYGRFLCRIFDEWVRNDVGRRHVQLFDVALESWLGLESSLCVFRETCGQALAIEHNGDLYSCDHFVYPENRLGNIIESPLSALVRSEAQHRFGANKRDALPRYCRECDVRFACNGECPKHRFTTTPDGEPGLNYLCAGYKMFSRHVDPYMRFMAAQLARRQAPAEVMAWARLQDARQKTQTAPARNAPCPCGSGVKFKKCCQPDLGPLDVKRV